MSGLFSDESDEGDLGDLNVWLMSSSASSRPPRSQGE